MSQETSASRVRVLQRVIMPGEELDVLPLYVETNLERGAAELASEQLAESMGKPAVAPGAAPARRAAAAGRDAVEHPSSGLTCPAACLPTPGPRRSAVIPPAAGCRSAPTSTPSRPATGGGGPPWTR